MPLTAPALDALRETLPEEFKDTKLNLSSVLAGENLADAQAWGVALAAARFRRAITFWKKIARPAINRRLSR